ncbi:hypothetical protein HDZ31DRAFT_48230 [Schizophyllum fasciatum]
MALFFQLLSHWVPVPPRAAPAEVALPEGRPRYGIIHGEARHFTLGRWLHFVYTDDVGRRQRPAELEHMRVTRVEHWKCAGGWRHEFLVFTLTFADGGEDFVRYIRVERVGQAEEEDEGDPGAIVEPEEAADVADQNDNKPPTFLEWSRGIKPRRALDANEAWMGFDALFDTVHIDPYRHDTRPGRRRWPAGSRCLCALDISFGRAPNVLHLALVLERVHFLSPRYDLLGVVGFWAARCVYEVLRRRFRGKERMMAGAGERGVYGGRVFVDERLRFNASGLTQDVLEKTVRKYRKHIAPCRWPRLSSCGKDSVASEDEMAVQELMTALNQERLKLLQANPDLFNSAGPSAGPSAGTTAGAASPSPLVQPVQHLLDSFDALYAEKMGAVRERVKRCMEERQEHADWMRKKQEGLQRKTEAPLAAQHQQEVDVRQQDVPDTTAEKGPAAA